MWLINFNVWSHNVCTSKSHPYQRFEFNKWESLDAETIVETPVSLTVIGEMWITFMSKPIHLEALAVGFLYNEGIIEKMDEVPGVCV